VSDILLLFLSAKLDRWAQPILMPLTGKMDFSEPLPTPRPARALLSLGYLHPVRQVLHLFLAYYTTGRGSYDDRAQGWSRS